MASLVDALESSSKLQHTGKWAVWGGLPEILGSLSDLADARRGDARLDYLLTCLDKIQAQSEDDVAKLVTVVTECKFEIQDLHRLNSPLLDGLYSVVAHVNGTDPVLTCQKPKHLLPDFAISCFREPKTATLKSMFWDAICLKASLSTLHFLRRTEEQRFDLDTESLTLLAMFGRVDYLTPLVHSARGPTFFRTLFRQVVAIRGAAINGQNAVLSLLLPVCHKVDEPKELALIAASLTDQRSTILYLLEQGANLHAQQERATVNAVYGGHVDLVRFYLSQGVKINEELQAVLAEECRGGAVEMIKLLLDAGASVQLPQFHRHGQPLLAAIMNDRLDVVQLLIERGADFKQTDLTALRFAVKAGAHNTFWYLLQLWEADTDVVAAQLAYTEALLSAVQLDNYDIAKRLLELGATRPDPELALICMMNFRLKCCSCFPTTGRQCPKRD